jgi:hypothetical protein
MTMESTFTSVTGLRASISMILRKAERAYGVAVDGDLAETDRVLAQIAEEVAYAQAIVKTAMVVKKGDSP